MTFATISTDAEWASRIAAPIIRPAIFVYLDWPSGAIRASTHNKSITILNDTLSPAESELWSAVGRAASIETSEFTRSGARVSWRLGITDLPQGAITEATEAAAIGVRCRIYIGLFNEGWADPKLHQIFIGRVMSAGDFKHRRNPDGHWVTDATVEVSNGRNPRRSLQMHHSKETAEGSDTGWRLLPTAGKSVPWPNKS